MTTSNTSETVQVAKTIISQIPMMDRMAIGFRKAVALEECDEYRGGVRFRVNSQPQRYCEVTLAWDDTYRVSYYRVKRGSLDRITLATADQVYADCLGTTLYNMTQATDQYNAQA